MNKYQLVSAIAENASLSLSTAEKIVDATLGGIVDTLTQGKDVTLVGFGRFGVKQRAARKVRNLQTGQEMVVKATTVPFFKAGKELKETVAKSKKD